MEVTKTKKHLFFIRLIVGAVFLLFGTLHLLHPEPFYNILRATQAPLLSLNTLLIPLVEAVLGLLLIVGLFTRLSALAGMVVMIVASWSTRILMHLQPSQLPEGMTEIPFYPPIFIPLILSILCFYLLLFGCGAWGLDKKLKRR